MIADIREGPGSGPGSGHSPGDPGPGDGDRQRLDTWLNCVPGRIASTGFWRRTFTELAMFDLRIVCCITSSETISLSQVAELLAHHGYDFTEQPSGVLPIR
jgi:hypothetical protein